MNDIQISLKANAENGILSIQGIDIFRFIDVDCWDWDNVASIKNPFIKTFFTQAKELLFKEDEVDESETGNDAFADWTNDDWAKEIGLVDDKYWSIVENDEELSDEIEISYDYDSDFYGRTEITLLTPYYKIVWDESVYLYIYNNLDLWLRKIEEDIKIYKELGNISNDFGKLFSTIKAASGPGKAIQNLIQTLGISEQTARTILEMKVSKLHDSCSDEYCTEVVQYREEQRTIFAKLTTFKKRIEKIRTKI